MSDKHLTELPWKALASKQGLKDLGLGKALAAYGNVDSTKEPAKALEGLQQIAELAVKLKKANPKNEAVVAHLDEVFKEVKKTTPGLEARVKSTTVAAAEPIPAPAKAPAAAPAKTAASAAQPAATAKPADDEEEEEKEAAAFKKNLKQQMVSALAQVKARAPGDPEQQKEPKPQLQFMACLAGKSCAVIVARKVGAATKKLLLELAKITSGGKFVQGECLFEKNTHTFVVPEVPSGLAKKLAAALQTETGQKYKVRARNTDGSISLDSDTDLEDTSVKGAAAGQGDVEGLYRGLLAKIPGELQKARDVNPGAVEKIQKILDIVAGIAAKGDYQKAFTYLDQAAKSLAQLSAAVRAKAAPDAVPSGKVAALKAALAEAQARWEAGVTAARDCVKPVQAGLKGKFAVAVQYIDNILNSYRQDLFALFQAAEPLQDQPSIDSAVKGILAKLQKLRAEIAGDDLFAFLTGRGIRVRQAFETALNEVQALLVS
jgi:hypothetical protein